MEKKERANVLLTVELPQEIIKSIDSMSIPRSRACRILINDEIQKYISLEDFSLKDRKVECMNPPKDTYKTRIGFAVSEHVNNALAILCDYYPFSKKALTELLLCQAYENNIFLNGYAGK